MTFICGQAGVYALGAVVAKHSGDEQLCDYYLTKFKEVDIPALATPVFIFHHYVLFIVPHSGVSVDVNCLSLSVYKCRLSFLKIFQMSCCMGELVSCGHVHS